MKIYHKIDDIPYSKMRAITIGAFDGVHLGHLKIIDLLKNSENQDIAKSKFKSMILTFEPIPRLFFNENLKVLTSIEERLNYFERLGVDEVFILPFDNNIVNISAEEFVKVYLYQKIGFTRFCIGFNHSFGKNREGNYEFIKKMDLPNTEIVYCEPAVLNDDYISSSKIRALVESGEIEIANKILGRNYSISGEVVYGRQMGRKIGFPTANVDISNTQRILPQNGVYACEVIIGKEKKRGMVNIGYRPTFEDTSGKTLEVNIFDFDEDIYGEIIEVIFTRFVRKEKKFNEIDKLIEQLFEDKKNCLR